MRRSDITRARRVAATFAQDASWDELSVAERVAKRTELAERMIANGGYDYRFGLAMRDMIRRNERALSSRCC
jgi:hypothetical protein